MQRFLTWSDRTPECCKSATKCSAQLPSIGITDARQRFCEIALAVSDRSALKCSINVTVNESPSEPRGCKLDEHLVVNFDLHRPNAVIPASARPFPIFCLGDQPAADRIGMSILDHCSERLNARDVAIVAPVRLPKTCRTSWPSRTVMQGSHYAGRSSNARPSGATSVRRRTLFPIVQARIALVSWTVASARWRIDFPREVAPELLSIDLIQPRYPLHRVRMRERQV